MITTDAIPHIEVATQAHSAPTVYVDNIMHIAVIDGVAKLRFVENLPQLDEAGNSVWSGRDVLVLTMPVTAVRRMIGYLENNMSLFDASAASSTTDG
jgi:hypothetical protein